MKPCGLVVFCSGMVLLIAVSCSKEKNEELLSLENAELKLRDLTSKLTNLETADNLDDFLNYYDSSAISMPEYQLTLQGRGEIKNFYREIFFRQKVVEFRRTSHEFIHLGNTIVEIGSFKKKYIDSQTDTTLTLLGKYWMVWNKQADGNFKIKGEAFGFFHSVSHPESLTVPIAKTQPNESDILREKEIPFELKAYNALMEKGVRTRDGKLRSEFFTADGRVYPFADTTVTGIDQIKPYLIEYSRRGEVSIDSIMCYTLDFINVGAYTLEYDMFKVKWRVPNFSGRTEGKGIRIWKRQDDGSLRLYREIGTHNHL
jgi:ketosteroid isomerase-like protein